MPRWSAACRVSGVLCRSLCGWRLQVNLWGLDAIKTKGESVAGALHMVGARPVREGTGRIARSHAAHALPAALRPSRFAHASCHAQPGDESLMLGMLRSMLGLAGLCFAQFA